MKMNEKLYSCLFIIPFLFAHNKASPVCHQCINYQEKIIKLQTLNLDLMKKLFAYRHLFIHNGQNGLNEPKIA